MDIIVSLIIIFGLILLNGFFSGAEIAIISLRKSRTQTLIDEGNNRAVLVSRLQNNPDNFFATVQIGVTLVNVIASVIAGERLTGRLEPSVTWMLQQIPAVGGYLGGIGNEVTIVMIVVVITYVTLVFGELVPKSLALHHSEKFALFVAYPLNIVSRIFTAFTRFLTFSSNLILKPFNDRTSFSETRLSPEEILSMVEEGVKAGTIDEGDYDMIENVLEIKETDAREVMVPRVDVQALPTDASDRDFHEVIDAYYSRMPVFRENLDDVIGILHIKDLMRAMARNKDIVLTDLVRPAYYVPETQNIADILRQMQKRKTHMAIVVDEFGGTAGLLTMEDILEEIVGEIDEVQDDPEDTKIISLTDGTYMVAGSCSVIDFNEYFESESDENESAPPELPESDAYASVAGFSIKAVGRFPEVGEKILSGRFSFELVKRQRQKLVMFKVTKLDLPEDSDSELESSRDMEKAPGDSAARDETAEKRPAGASKEKKKKSGRKAAAGKTAQKSADKSADNTKGTDDTKKPGGGKSQGKSRGQMTARNRGGGGEEVIREGRR